MSTYRIKDTAQNDEHLQALATYIINGWLQTKAEVKEDIWLYWTSCGDLAVKEGIVLKDNRIVRNSAKR